MTFKEFSDTVIPQWYRIGGKQEQLPPPQVLNMVHENFTRLFPYVTKEMVVTAFDDLMKGNIQVEHFGTFSELYFSKLVRESIEFWRVHHIKNPKPKPTIEASHQIESKVDIWETLENQRQSMLDIGFLITPTHSYNCLIKAQGRPFSENELSNFRSKVNSEDEIVIIERIVSAIFKHNWNKFKEKYKK